MLKHEGATVVFTIVANNYISYAATLMHSLRDNYRSAQRYVVICDRRDSAIDYGKIPANVLFAQDLEISGFQHMSFYYSVMELSTAIKPTALLHLMRSLNSQHYIYLDPDILVMQPLTAVERALTRGGSIVLTPHITAPLQDGFQPDDLTIMKSGVYNLGFFAASKSKEARQFIMWWQDRCRFDAIVDINNHKFTDQRWVDLAPAFVKRAVILHDAGMNVAYWNIAQRNISNRNGSYFANNTPVKFVHFSGISPDKPDNFSKHQNRFPNARAAGAIADLHYYYIEKLKSNDWENTRQAEYAYAKFKNGRKIHHFMRRAYLKHFRSDTKTQIEDPFSTDGRIFDTVAAEEGVGTHLSITPIMLQLWNERRDLQSTFSLSDDDGIIAFIKWFIDGGAQESSLDTDSIMAAKRILKEATIENSIVVPWNRQSNQSSGEDNINIEKWLAQPVSVKTCIKVPGVVIPRIMALLWERRLDLQFAFQNQNENELLNFLVWCITDGAREAAMDLSLVGGTLGPFLDAIESPGTSTAPPTTRLMKLLASRYPEKLTQRQNDVGADWHLFRIGLWLIGEQTRTYEWPSRFTKNIRSWMHQEDLSSGRIHPPIDNMLRRIYDGRPDLRALFDLSKRSDRLKFITWFIVSGAKEYDILPLDISPGLARFLDREEDSIGLPGLSTLHLLIWRARPDLQSVFPLSTQEGVSSYQAWLYNLPNEERNLEPWSEYVRKKVNEPNAQAPEHPRVAATGWFNAPSGRGEDARMTAEVLTAIGISPFLVDRGSIINTTVYENYSSKETVHPLINIMLLNADTVVEDYLYLRKKGIRQIYTIGYWAWELEKFPDDWKHAFQCVDEIWSSSELTFNSIRHSSSKPVFHMPLAVKAVGPSCNNTRSAIGVATSTFVVYAGFDYTSYIERKNPAAALEAFQQAFPRGSEDVCLILKTINGKNTPEHSNILEGLSRNDRRIRVINGELTRTEINALIDASDAYLSLHRSEGFGRGPAEAMALGKPVVVTGYSGNMDFTVPGAALLCGYDLVDVPDGAYPGSRGQRWAEPHVDDAVKHLRQLYRDKSRRKTVGERGKKLMERQFSVTALGPKYKARIEAILEYLERRNAA